jgi:hypothetical protein
MLRKTIIVSANAAAPITECTVEATTRGRGRGHRGGFGGGGHMDGIGGAQIDFGFGFAGSYFGTAIGLALFGLVLASFAGKAAEDGEQSRKACMYDALTVCAKFIPNREQIAGCLKANRERLSPSCQVYLAHGQ